MPLLPPDNNNDDDDGDDYCDRDDDNHLKLTGSTWLMIMHKLLRRDTLSCELGYKSQFPNRDVLWDTLNRDSFNLKIHFFANFSPS